MAYLIKFRKTLSLKSQSKYCLLYTRHWYVVIIKQQRQHLQSGKLKANAAVYSKCGLGKYPKQLLLSDYFMQGVLVGIVSDTKISKPEFLPSIKGLIIEE